ncbi:MAG: ABC transporter ATP-binding protein [Chloroflexota bacterium]
MNQSTAIQFENLSKTFGQGSKAVRAVRNLNLSIDTGQVYGFLGPNGAGKSTTIRMLMDLLRPTEGSVFAFGVNTRSNPAALQRVGALVEGAKFYNHLSGRDNLQVLGHTSGNFDLKRIEDLLDQVGMTERSHRKVEGYSTGMKQRLGIAAALLDNPDLVILDEPTNGLDPAGIQDMRAFIRNLAKNEGKTVFISSHLLNEIEQICDRVAIFQLGELLREGKVSELLADGESKLRVQAEPIEKAKSILKDKWTVITENDWLVVVAPKEDSPKVAKILVENNINIHQIIAVRQTLEDYFMAVTNKDISNE